MDCKRLNRKPSTNDVGEGIAREIASWQAGGGRGRGGEREAQGARVRGTGGMGNASGSPT